MISIHVHCEGNAWDVTIEDGDDGILAFEFSTKNDAMAFADRAADLFNSVGPLEITKPLTLSSCTRGDGVGEKPPLCN